MSRYYRDPTTGNEIPIPITPPTAYIKSMMLDFCYPVGSMYISTVNTSPATFLGGTWIQHEGYVLRGATSNVTADDNSNSGTGFGGSDTVTLTGAQSGLKGHGHGFTQPTVNGGATNTGGMSGNNPHSHTWKWPIGTSGGRYGILDTGSAGSSGTPTTNTTDIAHTHSQVAHTHSVSGGAVSDAAASDATSSHSVVQRYKNVYIWERTA